MVEIITATVQPELLDQMADKLKDALDSGN
jgi:hypothetical protein